MRSAIFLALISGLGAAALLLLMAGCAAPQNESPRYWPCRSHEIEYERSDGVICCLGGDAQCVPRDPREPPPLGPGAWER